MGQQTRRAILSQFPTSDPLLAGFFTVSEAARLISASSAQVRGWLNGYRNSSASAAVDRDFKGSSTVSFLDLIELRFIAHFRNLNVSMPTIRQASAKAKAAWGGTHPLAMQGTKYVTDRRKIFEQSAIETGDSLTVDLVSGQVQMWDFIEQTIAKGVDFDPVTHLAKTWTPFASEFPNVIIDPRLAFGKPSLSRIGVPTKTVLDTWKAEDGNVSRVAEWFHLEPGEIREALEYELRAA